MNQRPEGNQNGFSLVEIMIATMILTIGLLAMAASTGYVSKQLRSSIFDTQRMHAKEQIIEQLRASRYSTLSTSATATSVGRYSMTWAVSTATNYKLVRLFTSGPGYVGGRASQKTIVDTMQVIIVSP